MKAGDRQALKYTMCNEPLLQKKVSLTERKGALKYTMQYI